MRGAIGILALVACACGSVATDDPGAPGEGDAAQREGRDLRGNDDAGDTTGAADAGATLDASTDGAPADADAATDGGPRPDAGEANDAGPPCTTHTDLRDAACTGQASCPVLQAGKIECTHSLIDVNAALHGSELHLLHSRGSLGTYARILSSIDLDRGTVSERDIYADRFGILRMQPSGEPAILRNRDGELRITRRNGDTWDEEVQALEGVMLDARYDAAGTLHLFRHVYDMDAATSELQWLPLDGSAATPVHAAASRYVQALDGGLGPPQLVYLDGTTPLPTLRLWTAAGGSTRIAELPFVDGWIPPGYLSSAPVVLGTVLASWRVPVRIGELLAEGQQSDGSVYTASLLQPPLSAATWSKPEIACDAFALAPYPDICPRDRSSEPAGEQLGMHHLADTALGPLLVARTGQADLLCEWHDLTGCIETRTCECQQSPAVQFSDAALELRPLSAARPALRLPLEHVPSLRALVSARDGNRVVIVANYASSRTSWAHYFVVDVSAL